MNPGAEEYRFEVALSFPGEYRERVEKIAEALTGRLRREKVLYDRWYRAEFARPRLNVYLPQLYQKSRLLVFFLCEQYVKKKWCGLEWRVGMDLIQDQQDERLMFLSLDNAQIPGLFRGDGYLNIRDLSEAEIAADILTRLDMLAPLPAKDVDGVVRDLRERIRDKVADLCGTIRVLNMERPIELGSVYTAINILERRTSNTRKSLEEITREASLYTVHRFGIPPAKERVPGVSAFEKHSRLVIYGKPGAGKTTFLKHLAMECIAGRFRADLVPAFISLKELAETDGSPSLLAYLQSHWGVPPQEILGAGRGLILLDGLDEVRDQDFERIRKDIEAFTTSFARCTMAITCRIAAREYVFSRFTEVEMADFDDSQIQAFVSAWFGKTDAASRFMEKLQGSERVRELASSPLLLTLLCLVFEERKDLGSTRSELYKEGFEILLRKWDAKRNIDRDRPHGLSVTDLENLLLEIAYQRFQMDEYFFAQDTLLKQIRAFFMDRNLLTPGQELRADLVLNSVESHLGLLVQRAVGVYSFSHLTFQEYLTALAVLRDHTLLAEIGVHSGERRWREVWLLLVSMMNPDLLAKELKTRADRLVTDEPEIQKLLEWCNRKATAQSGAYKAAALRALVYSLTLARPFARALALTLARTLDVDLAREPALDADVALDIVLALALVQAQSADIELIQTNLEHAAKLARSVAPALVLELDTLRAERRGLDKNEIPAWIQRLRAAMIKHRDIGHDWNFTSEQIQLLEQYYDANLLLVDCMKEARGLTNATRQHIEDTILLPWDLAYPGDRRQK